MRLLTPLALVATLAAQAGAQVMSADEATRVLQAVSRVEEIAAEKPDLWPGMDLGAIPLAIVQAGGSMLLVGHPSPPVGRTYRTRPRAAVWVPSTDECWGVPSADLRGHRVACVDMSELLASAQPVPMLVAAAFRAFAGERLPDASLDDRAAYPDDDAANAAGLDLEQRILDEALATDPAATPARAREWLGVRRARRAKLAERARRFEQRLEMASLSAYAAARATATASDRFGRLATGIGGMLDRLVPAWRETFLASPVALEEIVTASVTGDVRQAADAARRRHGWKLILAEAQRRILSRDREGATLWGQIEAAGGMGVVAVELAGPAGVRAQLGRVRRIDAGRLVHEGPLRVDLGKGGLLRFTRPVAETLVSRRYAARMPPGTRVVADGKPVRLDVPSAKTFARLEVEGDGLRWIVEGGSVEVRSGGVIVRP